MQHPDELCAYSDMICAWILDASSMMCISCNGDSVITGCMVIRSTLRSIVSRNALTAGMRASAGVMIVVVIGLCCVVNLCVRQNGNELHCSPINPNTPFQIVANRHRGNFLRVAA